MTTRIYNIEIRGMPIKVVRKEIKNLHLGVYPPNGRIRVAAPHQLGDEAVRLAVISRLAWIRRQRHRFEQQERQSRREMVSGESHYYQGRRYRLRVIASPSRPGVHQRRPRILELSVPPTWDTEAKEHLLQNWYRIQLRKQIPVLLNTWAPLVGVAAPQWRIRKMKTRWGTCNQEAGRIWINLELAKKPTACLEYILVHEMVHLIERQHNQRFLSEMDRVMPQWRRYRTELNKVPLSHAEWDY